MVVKPPSTSNGSNNNNNNSGDDWETDNSEIYVPSPTATATPSPTTTTTPTVTLNPCSLSGTCSDSTLVSLQSTYGLPATSTPTASYNLGVGPTASLTVTPSLTPQPLVESGATAISQIIDGYDPMDNTFTQIVRSCGGDDWCGPIKAADELYSEIMTGLKFIKDGFGP